MGRPWMDRSDWGRSWKPWLRGTALGFPFGALPAGGAEVPTFLSYITERKLSKHPEEFGKGAIEGVAGPEAANNASAAGTLVPLLAIGLPTTATAAVILLAMQSYGIQPGPQLMDTEPELVWGLLASLFVANTLLLVLNLPLAPVWARAAADPAALPVRRHPVLRLARRLQRQLPGLRPRAAAGIGLLGLAMRRFGLPVLPLIIGVILGPTARGAAHRGAGDLRRRRQHAVGRAGRRRGLRRDRGPARRARSPNAARSRRTPDAVDSATKERIDA